MTTGICGTLTTFSTLQLELFEMVDGGYLGLAAAYVGATLLVGYAFVRIGIALSIARRRPSNTMKPGTQKKNYVLLIAGVPALFWHVDPADKIDLELHLLARGNRNS